MTQKLFQRVFLIVMDGVGVGAAPDAAAFGDEGSCTLGHVAANAELHLPTLLSLGLGNIEGSGSSLLPADSPEGFFGRLTEASLAKDTTTGQWELMGVIRQRAPRSYPNGFPRELVEEFSRRIGREVLGNRPASGTEIIAELGAEHVRTGAVIVYTSADSVFQIAAHKDVVPLDELYRICGIARELMQNEWEVDRVIARPFIGDSEQGFVRTAERRDFSLAPPYNYLDLLSEAGVRVVLIGKLEDIFAGRGFDESMHTSCSEETGQALSELKRIGRPGFYLANFIDFDMLYGHRNNTEGFADALCAFDRWLTGFIADWPATDLLILTADHGNDPTTPSTDHSRECVPLLVYHTLPVGAGVLRDLGTRRTFADVGATVALCFGRKKPEDLAGDDFCANISVGAEK